MLVITGDGASWIWNGYAGTLAALSGFVRPGGLIVSGEPFWKKEPDPEYIQIEDFEPETFATHAGNVQIGIDIGLTPLYTLVSSDDDFDRYEALQWRATERWAAARENGPSGALT